MLVRAGELRIDDVVRHERLVKEFAQITDIRLINNEAYIRFHERTVQTTGTERFWRL